MAKDKFLIAPFKSGLYKTGTPFLQPKDAFDELNNAYIFRGKIKKRFGSTYTGSASTEKLKPLSSRLRINIGTTDESGDLTVNPVLTGTTFKVGQTFSIGEEIFTIESVAAGDQVLLTTGASTTHTFNEGTEVLNIVASGALAICWFYYSEPVMGITRYEAGTLNDHTTIAFDTRFAYTYTGSYWSRLGTAVWTGDNYDYFWSANWDGIDPEDTCLFTTNFNTADPMRYYNGATWTNFLPKFLTAGAATDHIVQTAKIILPFKNRLLLLNTYEYDGAASTSHKNRVRYSWNGSPIDAAGYGWLEPNQANAGGAGYIDAPTEEEIVSAEFIRDRLIVYFENSTWTLAYTGNQVLPFVWQKLNTELGSQATFSSVPFDKAVLNIGLTGIHECNGANVSRIDSQIPDDIFNILHDSDQIRRIHGIRDYKAELVYWTLPKIDADDTYSYPDKILVYNYKDNTWAYNDDCILTFGYCEQVSGETWEEDFGTWEEDDSTWASDIVLSHNKQVIGGNQHGYIFFITPDEATNEAVLYVSNIGGAENDELEIFQHNLSNDDFVKITLHDLTTFTGRVTKKDDDTITVGTYSNAAYLGGANIERISKISIKSTLWNPYSEKGLGVSVSSVNFCVEKTDAGAITVDYTVSSADNLSMLNEAKVTGTILGDNLLETSPYVDNEMEEVQDRFWHKVYLQAQGEFVRVHLYFSDEQMLNSDITSSKLTIEAIMLETSPEAEL